MKREKVLRSRQTEKFFSLLCFILFCWISPGLSQGLPKIPIYIKGQEIWVEVAKSEEERAKGLMGRRSLGQDEGMLFIFEEEGYHGFWMKNTYLPLSIAFMDRTGKIVWITEMKPLTLSVHNPPKPILYALEMNKGWFAAKGIKAGDTFQFSK